MSYFFAHQLSAAKGFALATFACLWLLALNGGSALACTVCLTLPEDTIADVVLSSETVILARENPAQLFSFAPVATLKGSPSSLPIPHLVDSTSRRKLNNSSEDAVLFALVSDEIGESGPFTAPGEARRTDVIWKRLAYVDEAYRAIVEHILASGDDWDRDSSGAARFAFFERLHDHEDQSIRDLALREIMRAPYSQIRSMATRLSHDEITQVINDPYRLPWRPIHILLLGRSDDLRSHALIRRAVASAIRYEYTPNLDAWATAFIEIDGASAIDSLAAAFLNTSRADAEATKAVVSALAVHGTGGDPALRSVITSRFYDLADLRPAFAPTVAKHLAAWKDWSKADEFEQLLGAEKVKSPSGLYMLSVYVAMARGKLERYAQPQGNP